MAKRLDVRLTKPPEPGELFSGKAAAGELETALRALDENMERLAYAFDAIEPTAWTRPLDDAQRDSLRADWPADFTERAPANLLEILGFLRDEEAYFFGRRAMRLVQEDAPEFEHLTFEMAATHRDYVAETPAIHFSELVKNRHTWLALLRGEGPKSPDEPLAKKTGKLPVEESVEGENGEVRLMDIALAALRRDAAVHRRVMAIKNESSPKE